MKMLNKALTNHYSPHPGIQQRNINRSTSTKVQQPKRIAVKIQLSLTCDKVPGARPFYQGRTWFA